MDDQTEDDQTLDLASVKNNRARSYGRLRANALEAKRQDTEWWSSFDSIRSLTLGGSPVPAFYTTSGTWIGLGSSGVRRMVGTSLENQAVSYNNSDNSDNSDKSDNALRDMEVLTPIRATWR